jgi:hypothetical protein
MDVTSNTFCKCTATFRTHCITATIAGCSVTEYFCNRYPEIRFADISDFNEICFTHGKIPHILHSLWPKYVCLMKFERPLCTSINKCWLSSPVKQKSMCWIFVCKRNCACTFHYSICYTLFPTSTYKKHSQATSTNSVILNLRFTV